MPEYGVINEIGDLGLGFDPLSKKDQAVLEQQNSKQDDKQSKKDTDNTSPKSNIR